MLMCASPVVKALLHSSMKETKQKRITLEDCSLAAVEFLMSLIYTGGCSAEHAADTSLHASQLAHRWQVDDVVQMLETYISGLLTEASFEDIATCSQLLSLPTLKRACIRFAKTNEGIQKKARSKAKAKPFNKHVMAMLGCTKTEVREEVKKRRMF
eukprot:TRINITY_DN54076_c0_g1_i1.p1 TRINITY_DN54076_c0_g1~~TRINITY_DN54076_c0_g1_i1.p1  ORF type:complete len:156 (-),score=37.42 TRINITY_DN54076_c0_g1_i1:178-645(-)